MSNLLYDDQTTPPRSRRHTSSFRTAVLIFVLLAATAVMIPAIPAVASVVITPISATGYVHVANNGSAAVDVTVCASFDQPIRYVEALVQFSGGRLGVAILGPSSGAATNWCDTVPDLPAGPPGTVNMDISWSAHNGNGLSMGHAHSTSSFDVPAEPPTPKKTPEQASLLTKAAIIMAGAAAILTIGWAVFGLASVVAIVGASTAGTMAGVLGIWSGVYGIAGLALGFLSLDPPDPNYKVAVVPHNIPLPRYVASNGISATAADALNALIALQEDETGLADAMVAALYKAQGAAAVGDIQWERTQTLASADFAHQLATDLNSEPPLRRAARDALEAGGFPIIAITEAQAAAAKAVFDAELTSSQKDALSLGGAHPELVNRLQAIVRSSDPKTFIQNNILDLLAPPAGGPALNGIEQANAEAATVLLSWSDTLKRTPVGPLPPSPSVITSVQPNQGVAAGGTTVTISGSNLLDTTQVNFGTTPATSGTCTASECTVVSPSGYGTVDVIAIGPGGTSAVTPSTRFTYVTGALGPIHLPAGTLLTSGGFDPPDAASVESFKSLVGAADATKLGQGWEILAGSVDLVGPNSDQAAEGVQFVDLNGNDDAGPGTISQVVTTLPGHNYRLSFQLAGNPNGNPVVKTLTASFGTTTQAFTFDTTGHANLDLGWVEKTVDILSCKSTQRVTLQTTTTGQKGPIIDAVSVVDLGLAQPEACATVNPPIECLFNWADKNYPTLFAPSGSPTKIWTVYTYRYYQATNAYLGVNSVNNHVYYMGPDGVLQDEGPLSYWSPQAGCQVPPPPPTECLFNWAEKTYPDLFAPSGSPWAISSIDWTYRYYSATNAYLGVLSTNNDVYYMGPDGISHDEGPLSNWLPQAGCQ